MQFGLNFFPCVSPEQKTAERYFREAMHLCSLTDELGYTHIRQVEHYFKPYGGYSPDPLIFLSAAAALTRTIRLIPGAVLPVFNLAGLLQVVAQGEELLCLTAKQRNGMMAICIDADMPVLYTVEVSAIAPYRGHEFKAVGTFLNGLDEVPILSLAQLGTA